MYESFDLNKMRNDLVKSLTSFHVIDDAKILEIIDFFGCEGYNDEEDAFEDFQEKVKDWKKMPNPIRLYRVIGAENEKAINTDELGEHWTNESWNLDGDMLLHIGSEMWEDVDAYVVEALVPLKEINIIQTILQNLSFPREFEINLKDKGKNIKVDKIYNL